MVSCSSTIPGGLAESNYPIQTKNYLVGQSVQGEATGINIFGISFKKAYLHDALTDAQRKAQSDELIDLQWYVKTTYWVILPVMTEKIILKAQVVQINKGGEKND